MEQRQECIAAVQGLTCKQVHSLEIEHMLQQMEDMMQHQERFVDELICVDDDDNDNEDDHVQDSINKDQEGQEDVFKPCHRVQFELNNDDKGCILKHQSHHLPARQL